MVYIRVTISNRVLSIFNVTEKLCVKCDIETTLATHRKRKLPRRFAASVVVDLSSCSLKSSEILYSQTDFRQHVYLPVLDCIISEFESQFSQ